MRIVEVKTSNVNYQVLVAAQIEQLPELVNLNSCFAVIDAALSHRWQAAKLNCDAIYVDAGESFKSLANIEVLYQHFLDRQLDKTATVLAVGGGALTDAVGFAAATFHRGIDCLTVPSTLLAQVDASIGGKNGVNFAGAKNLIGTITQPKLVCCDLSFLATLPQSALSSGMAEVIKAAIISDPELFEIIKSSSKQIFALDNVVLEQVLYKAISVKAGIVSRDPYEKSERMKLNLGHTIGHALEVASALEHGQAVALGMLLETKLAVMLGLCEESLVTQIKAVCSQYKLATEISFNPEQIFSLVLQDKKKRSQNINFALPVKIGEVKIISLETNEVKKHISNLRLD